LVHRSDLRARLAVHQPLFGLKVSTPRVTLQLPTDPDLLDLLQLIDGGVHDPSWMPFSIPWTDTPQPERDRDSLAYWWRARASWSVDDWTWNAAVWVDDEIVGVQALLATDFPVLGEVTTGSWLGRAYQGKGIGREMRSAILHLAFEGLGARRAHSGYVDGNEASRRVSEVLGYVPNGTKARAVRGTVTQEFDVVLERATWEARRRTDVSIAGLEECRGLFGLVRD
jgi:RimJ/RimL family protein N-acetyltransferase